MANCYGKTLNQCMNEFAVSTETHFCHICKMDKGMKITREILQAPKLFSFLIIREFNYIKNMQKFDVNTSVDLNEHRYELKCALVHDGPMERGHYFAVCRYGDSFYKMDDANVQVISDKLLFESLGCAYNLIYERSDIAFQTPIRNEALDDEQDVEESVTLNMEMPVDEEVTCSSNTSNDNELASKFYY